MKSSLAPFLVVNPRSHLYGKESLALAQAADAAAKKTGLKIYFTCPFSDIRYIRENTDAIIVTAQAMESLKPGRGMGHLLPEALYEAGARATFLNHAENPMTMAQRPSPAHESSASRRLPVRIPSPRARPSPHFIRISCSASRRISSARARPQTTAIPHPLLQRSAASIPPSAS